MDELTIDYWLPPKPRRLWLPPIRAKKILVEWALLPDPVGSAIAGLERAAPCDMWDAKQQIRVPNTARGPAAKVFADARFREAWTAWADSELTRRDYARLMGVILWSAIWEGGGFESTSVRNEWGAIYERSKNPDKVDPAEPYPPMPRPILEPTDIDDLIDEDGTMLDS